jgi:hypothetical protein
MPIKVSLVAPAQNTEGSPAATTTRVSGSAVAASTAAKRSSSHSRRKVLPCSRSANRTVANGASNSTEMVPNVR